MTPQYIESDQYGNKFYRKDKAMTILHREDGPAVEGYDGYKAWWLNGKRHREDGPAVEWNDGRSWYLNGECLSEQEFLKQTAKEIGWYLNGECLSEQEFLKRTAKEIVLTMDEIAAKFRIEVSKLKIAK
jgi:hypothetical protein